MDIKIRIKNAVSNNNILAIKRRKRMRNDLKNNKISLLCPNCLGGMLLHDLNLPFFSPTINLMFFQKDFVKFVLNLSYYLNERLIFYNDPNFDCPCAKIGSGEMQISIHFTHYSNQEDAKKSWYTRSKRINFDNIFVILMERDGLTKKEIIELGKINVKGLVIFTAHEYLDIPYACFISKYKKHGEVGNILRRSFWNDKKEYEHYFDFVSWFNYSNGKPYNISNYIK